MTAKHKSFEQFGPYVLLKKLEVDALGDLWRAARIENNALGPIVALRRLTGGNREAISTAAHEARQLTPSLTGPTFARDQVIDVIAGIPIISHDYATGRTLRYIVDRARGGKDRSPNPIPIDQAVVIAERVALSLATTAEIRFGGERLAHGGLVPHLIWITEEGEIRVAGQHVAKGIAASLRDEKVAAEIGRYFSPEYQHSGVPGKSSEVYSVGAVLYLLLTGHEPPDALRASAFTQAVRSAKTMTGEPMPDDLRLILEKSLNLDPAARYPSVADIRNALSALSNSGRYSATSFNLAFYLTTLLKKELESEAGERERESKINVVPYLEALAAPAATAATAFHASEPPPAKRKAPLAIAAFVALVVIGVAAWLTLGTKRNSPTAEKPLAAATALAPQPKQVVPEPIAASASETGTAAPAGMIGSDPTAQSAMNEAARKKAFDDAVKQRLQGELMKLQTEHTRQLQQQQGRNAPVSAAATARTEPLPVSPNDARASSAALLDEQRRESSRPPEVVPQVQPAPPPAVQQAAAQSVPAPSTPPPAPAPAQATTLREGDVVEASTLDVMPRATRDPRPTYPPIAARQRIEATVMATVLVSETGQVLDVKVLRGDPRFGFNDSAVRALRNARYTSPMKDGKRVKTWIPQMIQFKP